MSLRAEFAERVAAGLRRKSLTTCSRWAEACRVMGGKNFPGPWRFKHHPWLKEMHDSKAELNIGQKSAQMGYTEAVLNIVFYNIDVKGVDVLYVLPAKTPDASDFSAARFDPALELSPHLSNLFSDVKNVGHKRAGTTNLYIRGSRARGGLKSVPTGLIILDEVDEMTQENIPLAMERAAGQIEKQVWMVSTATIHNRGINKYFLTSTQNHFWFICPHCSKYIELKWPESFNLCGEDLTDRRLKESTLICYECKGVLPHATKSEWLQTGVWRPAYSDRDAIGWHINQLYSPTMPPEDIAKAWLRASLDPASETEFYNSKLGVPHVTDGARVLASDIDEAQRSYRRSEAAPGGLFTLGVDVGKWCHWEICEWFPPPAGTATVDISVLSRCRVVTHGKCRDFEYLDFLMNEFQIRFSVIDAQPERRKAFEFANRHYGRVKINFYGGGVIGKNIHEHTAEPAITVDRTSWMSLALGRFKNKSIALPFDVDMEYKEHLQAPVLVYRLDKDGNSVGRFEKGDVDDHYAHARTYAEIAYPLALSLGRASSISSPI